MLISNMIFLVVSLRRAAPNTSEQRSRSGLGKRVIRREATETEGLVIIKTQLLCVCLCVCVFVCPDCIKEMEE